MLTPLLALGLVNMMHATNGVADIPDGVANSEMWRSWSVREGMRNESDAPPVSPPDL